MAHESVSDVTMGTETAVDQVAVEEGFLTFFRRILQEGTVK